MSAGSLYTAERHKSVVLLWREYRSPSLNAMSILTLSSLVVMAANCAGISGSQIFRTSDAPKYTHGLTAICALAGASWGLVAILCAQYYIRRRKSSGD